MYEQEITRSHRTAFVIAIDQSQSMLSESYFNGEYMSRAKAVARITDNLINELILRACRDEGMRDYYDIAILGYSDDEVYPLIEPQRYFIPVTELSTYKPVQVTRIVDRLLPDGSLSQYKETSNVWIAPKAKGNTPMYEAMLQIRDIVRDWCRKPQNADSFPPIIFNITDGRWSDCSEQELIDITEQIRNLSTSDGNALLINVHIAAEDDSSTSVIFPSADEIDPDNVTMKTLADCSSFMPEAFNSMILSHRKSEAKPPFRAMSYEASLNELIAMLNIGSRSITNIL